MIEFGGKSIQKIIIEFGQMCECPTSYMYAQAQAQVLYDAALRPPDAFRPGSTV